MQKSDIFLQNNYILGAPLDMSAAISTNGQINSSSAQMDNDGFTTSTPIPSVQDGFLPQTVPPLTSYMFKLTMLSHGGQALSNNSIPTLSCDLMLSALDTQKSPTLKSNQFGGTGSSKHFIYQLGSCTGAKCWLEKTIEAQLLTGAAGYISHKYPTPASGSYNHIMGQIEATPGWCTQHAAAICIDQRVKKTWLKRAEIEGQRL